MTVVAVTEHFLDGALRVLSGEAYEVEKSLTNGGSESDWSYVTDSVVDEDGGESYEYVICVPKDATTESIQKAKDSMAGAKKAQMGRAKKFGISIKKDGSVTKPAEWKDVPDSEFGDPVNYKYPMPNEKQARAAWSYWNQEGNQKDYTAAEKSKIEARITARCKELGVTIAEDDGSKKKDGDVPRVLKSQEERAADSGIAIKLKDAPVPAGMEEQAMDADAWADWTNLRYPIADEKQAKSSLARYAQKLSQQNGEYSTEEQATIMSRLAAAALPEEHKKSIEDGDKTDPDRLENGAVKKDIGDTFGDALDSALDSALVSAIDSVYYAFVKTYVGSSYYYPGSGNGDPDTLTREEFNALVGMVSDAWMAVYDKLADDAGDAGDMGVTKAMGPLFAGALSGFEKGLQTKALDELTSGFITKAGKRNSKADTQRLDAVHTAVVGLGYDACVPIGADVDDDDDDAVATKALREAIADATGLNEAKVADVARLARKHIRSAVTPPTGHSEGEEPDNDNDETTHVVKELQSELSRVKAESLTATSEVERLKGEQEARLQVEKDLQSKLEKAQADRDAARKQLRVPETDPLNENRTNGASPAAGHETDDQRTADEGNSFAGSRSQLKRMPLVGKRH